MYEAGFLPKLPSQNTAFCHEERAMSAFSSPVSMVYAWNAWDHDPPFGDQNVYIFRLGLSYGSPSNYLFRLLKLYTPLNICPLSVCNPCSKFSLLRGSRRGRKKISASAKQKNSESKAIGAETGEPVDFVFHVPIISALGDVRL